MKLFTYYLIFVWSIWPREANTFQFWCWEMEYIPRNLNIFKNFAKKSNK